MLSCIFSTHLSLSNMACGKYNRVFTSDNNNSAHFVANEEKLHEIYELLRVKPSEHFVCIF